MSECVCGHPQDRHAFGVWHCTVNMRAEPGVGWTTCHCHEFTEKPPEEPAVVEDEQP